MNGRSMRSMAFAALAVVCPVTLALAQQPAAPPPAAPAEGAQAAPAPAPADAPAAGAPAGSATPASSGAVTGYSYGGKSKSAAVSPDAPRSANPRGRMVHHANESVATLAGFEMLADGGSRLFVQLTKTVEFGQATGGPPMNARKAKQAKALNAKSAETSPVASSSLVVTLRGAEVTKRNNENALVTVHFNTPVVRARLVPAGRDLKFMLDLRADVTPTVKVVPTKDSGAMLQIDFPAGSYLPASAAAPVPEPEASDSTSASP